MFLSNTGHMAIGSEEGPNIVIETDRGVESHQFWAVELHEGRLEVAPLQDGGGEMDWRVVAGDSPAPDPDKGYADEVERFTAAVEGASTHRTPSGNAIPVTGKTISESLSES